MAAPTCPSLTATLLIPADVVVASEQHVRKWEAVKGTMIHEAMSQGRVVAES